MRGDLLPQILGGALETFRFQLGFFRAIQSVASGGRGGRCGSLRRGLIRLRGGNLRLSRLSLGLGPLSLGFRRGQRGLERGVRFVSLRELALDNLPAESASDRDTRRAVSSSSIRSRCFASASARSVSAARSRLEGRFFRLERGETIGEGRLRRLARGGRLRSKHLRGSRAILRFGFGLV